MVDKFWCNYLLAERRLLADNAGFGSFALVVGVNCLIMLTYTGGFVLIFESAGILDSPTQILTLNSSSSPKFFLSTMTWTRCHKSSVL